MTLPPADNQVEGVYEPALAFSQTALKHMAHTDLTTGFKSETVRLVVITRKWEGGAVHGRRDP